MTWLLNEIARCPHVQFCIQNPSVEHPCRQVVFSQSPSTLNEYQVPEPWSGRIEQAPTCFWAQTLPLAHLKTIHVGHGQMLCLT